jgi:hypothetical protein
MTKKKVRAKWTGVSLTQRNVMECGWILYITEGWIANTNHALTVNAYTMDDEVLMLISKEIERKERFCRKLREIISQIKENS